MPALLFYTLGVFIAEVRLLSLVMYSVSKGRVFSEMVAKLLFEDF